LQPHEINPKRPYTPPKLREMSAKDVVLRISEHSCGPEGPIVPSLTFAVGVVVEEYVRLAIVEYEKRGHEVRICNREGRAFYEIDRAMLVTPETISKLGAEMSCGHGQQDGDLR